MACTDTFCSAGLNLIHDAVDRLGAGGRKAREE